MAKGMNEATTYTRYVGFDYFFKYDSENRQEYVMICYPGYATSEAKWQIYKLSYDSESRQDKRRYADGNDKFDKIADDYSGYDYTDI